MPLPSPRVMPNAPAPRQLGTAGILVALGGQPTGLATHVPALPAAQISSGVRGATSGLADMCLRQDLARPSPIQLSFQTFVLSCPATRVLRPLPRHTFVHLWEPPGRAVSGGPLGWGPVDQTPHRPVICLVALDEAHPSLVLPEMSARGLSVCLFGTGLYRPLTCARGIPSSWAFTGTPPAWGWGAQMADPRAAGRGPKPASGSAEPRRCPCTHVRGHPSSITSGPGSLRFQKAGARPGARGNVGGVCLG